MSYLQVYGTVEDVRTKLGQKAPNVFGERAGKFVPQVDGMIVNLSRGHRWDNVYVLVSDGLADGDIERLENIEKAGYVRGPIYVDPTASTPSNQNFDSAKAVKSALYRLNSGRVNNDVTFIVHGLDKIDSSLATRLGAVNSHMSNEDLERLARQTDDMQPDFTKDYGAASVKQDNLLREALRNRGTHMEPSKPAANSGMESGAQNATTTGSNMGGEVSAILVNTSMLAALNNDPAAQASIENLKAQVAAMPAEMRNSGAAYEPIERQAIQLETKQEQKLAQNSQPERPEELPANNPESSPLPAPVNKPE